jgi:hypothetical protein
MFVACNHPSQDNDDLPPPVPLAMDGNALNPRRSPQLENHYKFLTGKRGASFGRHDGQQPGVHLEPIFGPAIDLAGGGGWLAEAQNGDRSVECDPP